MNKKEVNLNAAELCEYPIHDILETGEVFIKCGGNRVGVFDVFTSADDMLEAIHSLGEVHRIYFKYDNGWDACYPCGSYAHFDTYKDAVVGTLLAMSDTDVT